MRYRRAFLLGVACGLVIILNPFRSRAPERMAVTFLRSVSRGGCSFEVSDGLCKTVAKRPLPIADEWRLVNRKDLATDTELFYKIAPGSQNQQTLCVMAMVRLTRFGTSWQISGYGASW